MQIPIIRTIKNVINYSYVRKCMKLNRNDEYLNGIYKGMKLNAFGVLYFPLVITGDIDIKYHPPLLVEKLSVMDELLTEQQLMDLVIMEHDHMGNQSGVGDIYYIKIKPIIFFDLVRHLLWDLGIISIVALVIWWQWSAIVGLIF